MNAFLSGLLKALLAALLLVCIGVVGLIGYKVYYYEQPAAPAAVSNTPANSGKPSPLAGGYIEKPVNLAPRIKKPAGLKAGGGQACNGQAIEAGTFNPSNRTVVIVRETDARPGQGNFIGYWHVQWAGGGTPLEVGRGVAANGGNRDAWQVSCDLSAANADAYRSALADVTDGSWYGQAWMQIECVSMVEEIGATYNVQDMGGIAGGNHFVEVVPGYPEKYLVVCEAGAPEAPAEPEEPAQPAAPAAGCTGVKAYDPAYGEQPVQPGWILEEIVNNEDGLVTLEVVNASDRVAHINGTIHYNYWAYCSEKAALRGLASQYQEWLGRIKPGEWAQGYTITPLTPIPTR